MKLTNQQLRQIIKEELDTVTQEGALEQAKHLTQPPKNELEAAVRKMYDKMTPSSDVREAFDEAMKVVYRSKLNEAEKTVEDLNYGMQYKNNVKSPPKSFDYNNGLFAYTEDGVNVKNLDPDRNGGFDAVVKIFRNSGYRNNSVTVKG